MKVFNFSLPLLATLLAASFAIAAEQPKPAAPETSAAKTSVESAPAEKNKNYSEAAVACSETADKSGNDDKWDEAFQSCMKNKGFQASQNTSMPPIPDAQDAEDDM